MVTSLQQFIKYCKYLLTAANGKGHGIHSPFVFKFVVDVLNDERYFYAFETIESIVNTDLNDKKFNRLLFRIANYYQPNNILVIDETLGITTSYVALANTNASVSSYFFHEKNIEKVKTVMSKFKIDHHYFVDIIPMMKAYDLVYIYAQNDLQLNNVLKQALSFLHPQSILIIHNIHSSKEIEARWLQLQTHTAVTLTIDLFQIGLVFFRPESKIAQHFTIRF
ncbi:hypothetical protein ACFOW1_03125 [Parasediminibacterium paludis]|uniref:Methyltransferase n=1 Tax=Parasediminibacterium paludis TaxID=908966 RepID=A0ABV8PSL0_9BACT